MVMTVMGIIMIIIIPNNNDNNNGNTDNSTHLPSKILPGGFSLKSTESILYFHKK